MLKCYRTYNLKNINLQICFTELDNLINDIYCM